MKFTTIIVGSFTSAAINAAELNRLQRQTKFRARKAQQTISATGVCPTMIPPSPLAPDDSTCWQWWDPPANGILPTGETPPKGCDYKPCQDAVCECDNYCCDTAWDLSCRGYHLHSSDTVDNNYFVDGCSAKMLCCEPESAFPDPPIGGGISMQEVTISQTKIDVTKNSIDYNTMDSTYQCTPGTAGCCPTMIPPSFLPPDDSTCWKWWEPPADGILQEGDNPTKGCNYKPCQDAICQFDKYCCDTAWDLSCRGYHLHSSDTVDNNYFVDGCSAKMLCCEPESAY